MEADLGGWNIEDGDNDDWDDSELLKAFDRSIEKYQKDKKKSSFAKTNFKQVDNRSTIENTSKTSQPNNKKRKLTPYEKTPFKIQDVSSIRYQNQKLKSNQSIAQNQARIQKKNSHYLKKNTNQSTYREEKSNFLGENDEIGNTESKLDFYDEQEREDSELSPSVESDDGMEAANQRFAQLIQIGEKNQQKELEKIKRAKIMDSHQSILPSQNIQPENESIQNIQYRTNLNTTDKFSSLQVSSPINPEESKEKDENSSFISSNSSQNQMDNPNENIDIRLTPQQLLQESTGTPNNQKENDSFILTLEQEALNDMLSAWYQSGYYAGRYRAVQEFFRYMKK